MIVRDEYGIVVQQPIDINSCDDSLARTSLLILGGSKEDEKVLEFWYPQNGEPGRHPFKSQANQYSGPNGLSRDQLICYVAALNIIKTPEALVVAEKIRKRHGMFINKDVLMPDLKFVIAKAANHWSQYLWAIPGIPSALVSILWSCFVTPKHELNQIFAELSVVGNWSIKLLRKLHPNWKRNLEDYWGTNPNSHGAWRQMPEMAKMMISKIEAI